MKRAVGILLFLTLAGNVFAQKQTFSLQGVVVRNDTGDPLTKARVELRGGSAEPMVVTTASDGRFIFPNLQSGTYEIAARRDGFAPAEFGQR